VDKSLQAWKFNEVTLFLDMWQWQVSYGVLLRFKAKPQTILKTIHWLTMTLNDHCAECMLNFQASVHAAD